MGKQRIFITGGHKVERGSDAYHHLRIRLSLNMGNRIEIGHGGATGIDTFADEWAKEHQIPVYAYPPTAFEKRLGKWGKFIRNGRALREFKPDKVIAIGTGAGNGTRNCASQAAAMGIDVEWVCDGQTQ